MLILGKKRAQIERTAPLFLAMLVLGIVTIVTFFLWYEDQKKSTEFEKEFLARDMALTITSIITSPHNLRFDYNEKTFWLSFAFTDKNAIVTDPTTSLQIARQYPFYRDKITSMAKTELVPVFKNNRPNRDELEAAVHPIFIKEGNIIRFENQLGNIQQIQQCPYLEKTSLDYNNIKTTVKRGEGIQVTDTIREGDVLELILSNIKAIKPITQSNGEVKLLLGFGNYEFGNILKIYIPLSDNEELNTKIRTLACHLINSIIDSYDIYTSSTIIISHDDTQPFNQFLKNNENSLYIELGNINAENIIQLYNNPEKISNAINNVFQN